MLDLIRIEKRITDLELDIYNDKSIIDARLDILYWVKINEPNEKDIQNKIDRIKEEMLPLDIMDKLYLEKQAKIKELNELIT